MAVWGNIDYQYQPMYISKFIYRYEFVVISHLITKHFRHKASVCGQVHFDLL